MWFLDQVAEARATKPRRRMPTRATAYLMAPPSGGRALVRLWDGEPTSVPAQPGVYSGITTVDVQVDEHGRPVLVYGPTTAAPVTAPEEPPTAREPVPDAPEAPKTVERSTTVYPADSATYNSRFGNWTAWGGSMTGYPYTAFQGYISSGGTLTGAAFYGSAIRGLSAVEITRARVRIVSSGIGYGWTPVLRLTTNGSRPGGLPSYVGESFSGPSLAYNGAGWVDVPEAQRELLRTGAARGLALVGSDHGATRGKGTAGLSLSLVYKVAV